MYFCLSRSDIMKKKNKSVPVENVQQEPVKRNPTAFPLSDMVPGEELQIYYNEAYMREKQRFNDIFGIIEQEEPEKEKVYVQPSPDEYVTMKQYRRSKRTTSVFVFLTLCLAAAVAVLVLKVLNVF